DRVLNKGVVIAGEVVISVADVDLIYLGLQLILTSVETASGMGLMGPSLKVSGSQS
ncbi:MAG: gas vesicle protein, partial [Planctomycetota bacterium]|nr:gas vesicle protein [Planctomycetota bacterium]